jgi:predicted anti-sigma-YlaC factor YlaD
MKITQDVIFDLLPAYFANEVSADTRALVDEFFVANPEFKRMAERFRTLSEETQRSATTDSKMAREQEAFDRARVRATRRLRARASAVSYALGAVVALSVGFLASSGSMTVRSPGVVIAIVFGVVAIGSWIASYRLDHDSWLVWTNSGDDRWNDS